MKRIKQNLFRLNIIFLTLLVLASAVSFFKFITYNSKKRDVVQVKSQNLVADKYEELTSTNESFAKGREALVSGDSLNAIVFFKESKKKVTSNRELSLIDFNIAVADSNIDLPNGIKSFIELSENESYDKRTRALAMLRAYLTTLKFNDPKIMVSLFSSYGIQSSYTKKGDISSSTILYMQKVSSLYPFAYPVLFVLKNNLQTEGNAENKNYREILDTADINLREMSKNSGEVTEYTSSLLLKAQILGILSIKYKTIPLKEAQDAYTDLINFCQQKNITVTKQYALLSYANFLAGAKDYKDAENVMGAFLSEKTDKSIIEAMKGPGLKIRYGNLEILSRNTKNQDIINFVQKLELSK